MRACSFSSGVVCHLANFTRGVSPGCLVRLAPGPAGSALPSLYPSDLAVLALAAGLGSADLDLVDLAAVVALVAADLDFADLDFAGLGSVGFAVAAVVAVGASPWP